MTIHKFGDPGPGPDFLLQSTVWPKNSLQLPVTKYRNPIVYSQAWQGSGLGTKLEP
jgi:hypothetical protein